MHKCETIKSSFSSRGRQTLTNHSKRSLNYSRLITLLGFEPATFGLPARSWTSAKIHSKKLRNLSMQKSNSNSDTWLSHDVNINHKPKPKFVWVQLNNKTFWCKFCCFGTSIQNLSQSKCYCSIAWSAKLQIHSSNKTKGL